MKAGVYSITNVHSGKKYIGSSRNIEKRWERHRQDLRYGIHHNVPLQRAFSKYGYCALEFRVLLYCAKDQVLFYEQLCLNGLRPEYNTSKIAGRPEHTPEVRAKLSKKMKTIWACPERRQRVSEKLTGRKAAHSYEWSKGEEYRARIQRVHRDRLAAYEYDGRKWSIKDLAEHYNMKYTLLGDRLRAGWTVEKALTTPRKKWGGQ